MGITMASKACYLQYGTACFIISILIKKKKISVILRAVISEWQ
jgi:hypothetical protein